MEILADLGLHALLGDYLEHHPLLVPGFLIVLSVMGLARGVRGWWEKREARLRIRRAIGQDIKSESELTSLNTWMKVEHEEEQQSAGKLPHIAGVTSP